jgi:SAM-dependent methyltransferase
MRQLTKLVVVAGGVTAAVAGGAVLRNRLAGPASEGLPPDPDAMFKMFAPGGKHAYWCNGPTGWLMAKAIPRWEAGLYGAVAEMLDLQPDDELLDIGCGPGAFLAAKAQRVRRVVGLDVSQVMLREAELRLADRIAAGTAQLVTANAAELPFEDGAFSAVTALNAPIKHAEAFRVLRPGGRLVFSDPDPRRSPEQPAVNWGVPWYDEASHRQLFEDAGFTDITVRYAGLKAPYTGALLLGCRKPDAPMKSAADDTTDEREVAGSAAAG